MKKIIFFINYIMLYGAMQGMVLTEHYYLKTYPIPWKLHDKIRSLQADISDKLQESCTVYKLADYFVKKNISRVRNAQRMRRCIRENEFDCLYVPKKYLYHLQGRPYDFNDSNYWTVAEALELHNSKDYRLNLKQTKQLFSFLERTGYCDIHSGNICVALIDGVMKLAIIDTEDSSFICLGEGRFFDHSTACTDLLEAFLFEDDALLYLIEQRALHSESQDIESASYAE